MILGDIGKQIVEQMPMAFALVDIDLRYLVANRQWQEQFGLAPNVGGSLLSDSIPFHWQRACQRCLDSNTPHQEIETVADSSNRLQHIHWHIELWQRSPGQIGGLMIYIQITPAIDETQERYWNAMELTPMAIAIHRQGKIEYANPSAARIIGASDPSALIGMPMIDFVHPDYHNMVLERVQQMEQEQAPVQLVEEKFIRLDGQVIDVEVAATHITVGNQTAHLVVFNDITTRKRTAEALRLSEARNRAILQAIPDIIFVINRHGVVEDYQAKAEWLFGQPASINGIPVQQLLPIDVVDLTIEHMQRAFHSGDTQVYEYQLTAATGEPHHYEARMTILDENRVLATIRDISIRKQAEQVLLHQKDFLSQVINASPNLISVKDAEGRYILVNQALADVYNTSIEALLGRRDEDLNLPPEMIQRITAADQEVLETLEPLFIHEETLIHLETGERHFYQTRKVPILAGDGAPQVLSVASEISGWKLAETEREQRLERERTARREAQDAVRMKDMFLATMSHELRTPLNAVIGYLHLLLFNKHLNDEGRHMVERAIANSQRLLILINNVLTISDSSTGQLKVVATATSVRAVARNVKSDLEPQAVHKGLDFAIEVDEDLPDIITHDEHHLLQIATNLTSNAIKFTEQGFVRLAFRCRDDCLIIQVEDSGIGIPSAKRDLIFEDFIQVDGSYTRKHQGAGLGLAIVKRLTTLMDGTVEVVSEVGQGSTFIITLPLNLPA